MSIPMHPLVDFLNHGTLPFTGRSSEADRIVEFWRAASEAPGLQALLLLGEVGVGKSRLVEELGARVARAGGAVLHTKLYPESATSIVPLVTRSLWRFNAAHPLLKSDPEDSFTSVLGSLRRLVRLRHSMLIFEDIHLLSGGGVGDFGMLLDALADEHVAVLCLGRPVELAARGALERHLTADITLHGLSPDEVGTLWGALFGSSPDPVLRDILHRATAGNPLAIRSALRGALKSGALTQDGSGIWRTPLALDIFEETLERNVELLSEGMASHLGEHERRAAEKIARLGEVFAYESARTVVGGDTSVLDTLTFKGIIAETGSMIPSLSETTSRRPLLAFTHTLLHRRLIQHPTADLTTLAEVIVAQLPLYSVVPFRIIAEHGLPDGIDITGFIDCVTIVTHTLNNHPDWKLGMEVWETAWRIFEGIRERLSDTERFKNEAVMLTAKILLLRRQDSAPEYKTLVEQLDRLTDRPLTAETAVHRLRALRACYWMYSRRSYDATRPVHREVLALVAEFPHLKSTKAWVDYLQRMVNGALVGSDFETARFAETELNRITGSAEIDEELKAYAFQSIAPYLLVLFDSAEELERRIAMIEKLEQIDGGDDIAFLMTRMTYYMNIDYLHRTMALCRKAIPLFRERGQARSAAYATLVLLYCRAAYGENLDEVESEVFLLCSAVEGLAPHIRMHAAIYFSLVATMLGNAAWGLRMISSLVDDTTTFNQSILFYTMLEAGDPEHAWNLLTPDGPQFQQLTLLIGALRGNVELNDALDEAREALRQPILRSGDVLKNQIVIAMIDRLGSMGGRSDLLAGEIHESLIMMIDRYLERRIPLFAKSLIDRFGGRLARNERSAYATAITAMIRATAESRNEARSRAKIRLGMLGSIAITRPDQEPLRPRGVRLRTLLGLMVADQMLDQALSQKEFCRLAAGDASDFEDARKTVNLAVHRLREILGHEAILTDRETPRLNPDLVDADLLHLHRLLADVDAAVRDGAFSRGSIALVEALERAGGEVAFPGLYDEFFEAAREDLESRIRTLTLRVAKGLLHEGDAASAEGVLRRAFTAMPEDEEIAAQLADVLIQLGKRIEAQRVRLQNTVLTN